MRVGRDWTAAAWPWAEKAKQQGLGLGPLGRRVSREDPYLQGHNA